MDELLFERVFTPLGITRSDLTWRANHYGLLWWNNADGTKSGVPSDACWAWGFYDSLIVVIPSLDIVVARAGQSWKRTTGADHYEVLKPFFLPISSAAKMEPPKG